MIKIKSLKPKTTKDMKALFYRVLPIVVILFASACSITGPCLDKDIQFENLETLYGCHHTVYQMDADLEEDYVIISSQKEFEELVSGSCQPEIDFESYNLLLGKKHLSSAVSKVDYNVRLDCKGEYQVTVTFYQTWLAEAPNATYHVLIPKKVDTSKISVAFVFNGI